MLTDATYVSVCISNNGKMLFSSLEFIFCFLPLCLAVYFLIPKRYGNVVLLLFSLLFYGLGEPVYLFLMVFTVVADYIFGLLIQKYIDSRKASRAILVLAIAFNISILFFFKYYDTLAAALSKIPLLSFLHPLGISLPIGISFYTFQSLSYVIDVYKREAKAAKDPILPATYVTLFPQLIAGPIIKYNDIESQLSQRRRSIEKSAEGLRRFACGLGKKVLLANTSGEMWQEFTRTFDPSVTDVSWAWLGIIFYTFQIYFDFSGYSDMAIGLGKIFGFDFPENFNYPYVSQSITEFWRRWHITLSSWFREYVYIPLGGNRRGKKRTYINLFIVWSLTGIWHGAEVNFWLWGIYYFIMISLEKAFLSRIIERAPKILRHLYTLILIMIGWMIFTTDGSASSLTLSEGLSCLRIMFGISTNPFISADTKYQLARNFLLLIILTVSSIPLAKRMIERLLTSNKCKAATLCVLNALSLGCILLCTAFLVNSGYNPFLYFKF